MDKPVSTGYYLSCQLQENITMSELDFLTIIWTLIALPVSFVLALLGVEVWEFFTYRKR